MAQMRRATAQPLLEQPPAAVAAARLGARRVDQVLALCYCAAEAWTLCSVPPSSSRRYAAQTLLLAVQTALLAFFLGASWARWRRYRTVALGVVRLSAAIAHAPLLYGTQAGLGQLLHRPASSGALGAAADWLSFVAGLLPSAFVCMACRLSPAATLVQQAAVVAVSAAVAGSSHPFCGSLLLSDPLSAQRMDSLHRLLDASDPLGHSPPTEAGGAAGAAAACDPGRQCTALYYFHVLVIGVLLPAALSLRSQLALPAEPAGQHGRPWRGGGALAAGLRQVLACRPAAALLGWLALSTCWLACKVLASHANTSLPLPLPPVLLNNLHRE